VAVLLAALALLAPAPSHAGAGSHLLAPHWQNRTLHEAPFGVELPQGRLDPRMRACLSDAMARMGRWVRED
jgi:hypothetical protein